ncbi:MAG: hypothetical protein H6Q41_3608 [Deltaproteobacteria bacterium]|nr:hypothetical protein [Deltaproteobacteria bacterium]
MLRFKLTFLALLFLLNPTVLLAQTQFLQEKESIHVVVKDVKGERLEGYLQLYPNEITVSTKDDQEKSIPLKIIESIKVEKIQGGIPGANHPGAESYYSVRVQNSQEIFTLKKKVTFSLNTSAGVVTKTLDPEAGQAFSRKDSSSLSTSQNEQPLIRGEGVALSLEIKF